MINDGIDYAEEVLATLMDTVTHFMDGYVGISVDVCNTIGGDDDDGDDGDDGCLEVTEVCDMYTRGEL